MHQILESVRIIDAGTVLAAPAMSALLSDFGAEVIKIEQPGRGDPIRSYPPHAPGGQALTSKVTNRNKRSVTLDVGSEAGRAAYLDLVAASDVVVVNFRLPTLRKWRIDYSDLIEVNPEIVMLHLTGFGRTGPYADRPAFSRVVEAYTGLTHATGQPDGRPIPVGTPIADHLTGVYGAMSILMALLERRDSGRGQLIDLSLAEALIRVLDGFYVGYDVTGYVPERAGTANPTIAPHDTYRFADGAWVQVPCSTQSMFERLCTVLGAEEVTHDQRFATNEDRVRNRAELDGHLVPLMSAMDSADFLKRAHGCGIAAGRINSAADLLADEHAQTRGIFETVFDPGLDRDLRMQSVVPRFSRTPGEIRWPGHEPGDDTDQVLAEVLGYSPEVIARLRADGVV